MDKEVTVSEASYSTHIRNPKEISLSRAVSYDPADNEDINPADLMINAKPRERLLTI